MNTNLKSGLVVMVVLLLSGCTLFQTPSSKDSAIGTCNLNYVSVQFDPTLNGYFQTENIPALKINNTHMDRGGFKVPPEEIVNLCESQNPLTGDCVNLTSSFNVGCSPCWFVNAKENASSKGPDDFSCDYEQLRFLQERGVR